MRVIFIVYGKLTGNIAKLKIKVFLFGNKALGPSLVMASFVDQPPCAYGFGLLRLRRRKYTSNSTKLTNI